MLRGPVGGRGVEVALWDEARGFDLFRPGYWRPRVRREMRGGAAHLLSLDVYPIGYYSWYHNDERVCLRTVAFMDACVAHILV